MASPTTGSAPRWRSRATAQRSSSVLTRPIGGVGTQLGASVAIDSDGTTIAAGAPANLSSAGHGTAYVFLPTNGSWVNNSNPWTFTASDGAAGDALGSSIAISSQDGS